MTDVHHLRAAEMLEHAAEALRAGDPDRADFHLRCAAHVVDFKTLADTKTWPVVVAWELRPKLRRTELVVVEAASRALAHENAQAWARQSFNISDQVTLVSSIQE